MGFVNLNKVYLLATGGTVKGDVDVNGAVIVNDGSGNGTTYDVAAEITNLKNDYIVERFSWTNPNAASDVYNIEKWASGYIKATGSVTYSSAVSVSNSYGSWYYKSFSGWAIPPYFTEITYANVFLKYGSGLWNASIHTISSDLTTFGWYLHAPKSDTIMPLVYITFEGKWKD